MVTLFFDYSHKDLDLPDAPRIKQLDEFLEGYYLYLSYCYYIVYNEVSEMLKY